MADSKSGNNAPKTNEENPSFNPSPAAADLNDVAAMNTAEDDDDNHNNNQGPRQSRTPFTDLSQVDADLALARTLQEQERAYMMIRMNGDVSDYGRWEAADHVIDDVSENEYEGSDGGDDHEHEIDHESEDYDDEEDAFDVHAHEDGGHDNPRIELDPADFPNDEAYARALQDAEDREMASRLLALSGISGIHEVVESESEELEDNGRDSQDAWEEVDPDELSYEELIALGDVVGTESRGLSADTIASLPSMSFKMQNNQDGNIESCVICRLDYEEGETLTVLACKHSYHPECINNWLCINKVCPVCSAEVSTPGNS